MDSGAVAGCGRVALDAVPCSVARSSSGDLVVPLPAAAPPSLFFSSPRPSCWVVWCSPCGIGHGGLVLWLVVATPRRRCCERDKRVLCLGVRGACRGLQCPRAQRWSRCVRECAVLVCLETGDGLGLRAHGMERHGRSSKVRRRAGGKSGAHRGCCRRKDGGAVTSCGRVAPEAVPCSADPRS